MNFFRNLYIFVNGRLWGIGVVLIRDIGKKRIISAVLALGAASFWGFELGYL